MRVLGVDPGLRIAGYGCIDYDRTNNNTQLIEGGAIRLDPKQSVSFRLSQLYCDLQEIISDTNPELIAVETIFTHSRQVATATILGHARGVILLAGEQASLPLVEITPAEIKKSMTGNGRATKVQIGHAVTSMLDLQKPPDPPDVSDALAIAITAAVRQ